MKKVRDNKVLSFYIHDADEDFTILVEIKN